MAEEEEEERKREIDQEFEGHFKVPFARFQRRHLRSKDEDRSGG